MTETTTAVQQRVRVRIEDHVATVTLSRPEKHNALDLPMFDGILAAVDEVRSTRGVRAVVLHGDGPSFCSGLDIVSVMSAQNGVEGTAGDAAEGQEGGQLLNVPNKFQRVAYDWVTLPVPVIAALHGNCLGGGFQIALGADIRFATPDCRLSVMEGKWGLIPDMSITRTLPRLVGIDVAKELTYTARVFTGQEGAQLGVITHLADDPLGAARKLASEIAGRSPDAVRRAKRLFEASWTAPPEESLRLEAELQLELIGSPNQLAAVMAGMRREDPEFEDPE
jgi:enoyl-CoA hydratase/carnithine racemase